MGICLRSARCGANRRARTATCLRFDSDQKMRACSCASRRFRSCGLPVSPAALPIPHPARATGGTATPAPEAPWRPGETASKNQAETSSTTKDGGAQRPANAMPAPKPRACATLSDCVAACASADSQCSSQDCRVATTVKDICVDKCRNILKGSPKGLNRIPAKLFGFELERPFSDAEARCSELEVGGRAPARLRRVAISLARTCWGLGESRSRLRFGARVTCDESSPCTSSTRARRCPT